MKLLNFTLLALGLAAASGSKVLDAGDMAPAFSLTGSDGKTYTLSEFRGKEAVVVAWFPKAFTGG
jgi:peroxiredoxin Q/BCP